MSTSPALDLSPAGFSTTYAGARILADYAEKVQPGRRFFVAFRPRHGDYLAWPADANFPKSYRIAESTPDRVRRAVRKVAAEFNAKARAAGAKS